VTEGGAKFADEVYSHPGTQETLQKNGRFRYDAPDLGRVTGYDASGSPVRGGRIITEPDGTVVTQFPQPGK
jgi:hypothetical protein